MELQHLNEFDKAVEGGRGELVRFGASFLFLVGVMFLAATQGLGQERLTLVMGAIVAAYMAMNIGANDVANNVGPAVGSRALSLVGALTLAATFELAGALIAGQRVVERMRSGILHAELVPDPQLLVWVLLAALLASAIWINLASMVGAPVSTTHSIVGGLMGGGIAAQGLGVVSWPVVVGIVASWIVSPLLGGVLAAGFLYLIKRNILRRVDMAAAARRVVPRMLGIMAGVFTAFLIVEGLRHLLPGHHLAALACGLAVGVLTRLVVRTRLQRPGQLLANTRQGVNRLFRIPLIFAAAIMSFAHGSNDVANAIGPLAAIVHIVSLHQGKALPALVPLWVLLIGAAGIAGGLLLFGSRVIRTIGTELTELDNLRAFSIALASALTVILASVLGLPVSTTHVVVGAVLGVGFLREYLHQRHEELLIEIRARHPGNDQSAIDDFMQRFEAASVDGKGALLKELKLKSKRGEDPARFTKAERKSLRGVYRQELVKRSQLRRILAAWVITLPASALMAAGLFHLLRLAALP